MGGGRGKELDGEKVVRKCNSECGCMRITNAANVKSDCGRRVCRNCSNSDY